MSATDHPDPYDMATEAHPAGPARDAYADGARAERVRVIDHLRKQLREARASGAVAAAIALRTLIEELQSSLDR